MCGIAGIFDPAGERQIEEHLLHRMNQAQFHRGPDEGGMHIEMGVGLAHRRLSIIDISTGQQPLWNADNSVCTVFNGEIYNFKEIRKELETLGYVFRTESDTEVLVYAWQAWGEACVQRLRGMFSFAIWDRNLQTLFLARDRLGIKPLYYGILPDGQLVFGSELKVLTAHPALLRKLDPYAVEDYFTLGYIPEPRTIYQRTFKLPPGHSLTVKRGGKIGEPKCYWDVSFKPRELINEQIVEAELIERFREAVNIRLISEVPLGAFLSGGVDSSGVVAMMAQSQEDPVNTCSISFKEKLYNESEFAQMVADRYQTNHRVKEVNTDDFDLIDQLAALYDEPFADSSALPTYRVCGLAKEEVTVALSGDGGDETFAGYRRYRWHMNEERLRAMLPLAVRRPIFGLLGRLYPKADWAPKIFRAKSTFQSLAMDTVEGYYHSVSLIRARERKKLFSSSLKKELAGYSALEVFRKHAKQSDAEDPLSLIQYLDLKTYLVGDILTKVDRASMAHALEVRVPLLDHEFVEWACALPHHIKLSGQIGKYLFKKSLEPHLPEDVLYRAKMGFAVPLDQWFKGPLKEKIIGLPTNEAIVESGMFDSSYVKKLVDQHLSGVRNHSAVLWSLLMFESFLRQTVMPDAQTEAA